MPELPEVETIRRQLEREIKGKKIEKIQVISSKPLNVSAQKFKSAAEGAKIKEVGRRAKLLILFLSNSNAIMFHLKMTGRLLLSEKNAPPTKHTHVLFELSGKNNLFFEDYRKFGFIKLIEEEDLENYFAKEGYGVEPLSKDFDLKIMKACLLSHKKQKIKQVLMDQKCIAGIGNIYASEICFYAKINPERRIGDIEDAEFKKIFEGTKKILTAAIDNRGSSADSYVDAFGKRGEFVPKLKVYGREGEKCLRCGGTVKKQKIGGRGTFWCPDCQK